jgi:hypothetical protein
VTPDDNRKLAELADGLHSIRYPKRMRVLEDTDPLTVRTYYEMASFARRFCEEWLVQGVDEGRAAPAASVSPGREESAGGGDPAGLATGHQPPPEPVPHVSDHFVPEDEWDGDIEDIPF